ncbi:MAG: 50S ribosomal protein L11 methyltransferase [Paludibacteraceae bacterium]
MLYSVAHFKFRFAEAWQADVFAQALFDIGFDTIDGEDAYIPTAALETAETALQQLVADTRGVELLSIDACPDQNWNAVWEAEHPVEELPLGVRIVPHCAFGAGHHETTGMMIDALLRTDLTGKTVLDNGCGTGILGIFAAKQGAARVIAVDIDDKSVQNTAENALLNGVQIEVSQGSMPPCPSPADGASQTISAPAYDLIMANIHRNILLQQMPLYAQYLRQGGMLMLSGFYADDCSDLVSAAAQHHLRLTRTDTKADDAAVWAMLTFVKVSE